MHCARKVLDSSVSHGMIRAKTTEKRQGRKGQSDEDRSVGRGSGLSTSREWLEVVPVTTPHPYSSPRERSGPRPSLPAFMSRSVPPLQGEQTSWWIRKASKRGLSIVIGQAAKSLAWEGFLGVEAFQAGMGRVRSQLGSSKAKRSQRRKLSGRR